MRVRVSVDYCLVGETVPFWFRLLFVVDRRERERQRQYTILVPFPVCKKFSEIAVLREKVPDMRGR